MSFFDKIMNSGEEKLLVKFREIITIGLKSNKELEKLFDKKATIDHIRKLERESDDIAFEIYNIIISGAIAPNLIDIFLDFVNTEDNIIDTIYNLARELLRYDPKDKKIKKYIRDSIRQSISLTENTLNLLFEMETLADIEKIKRIRRKIQENEQLGDRLKDSMIDLAYKEKMDFKTFYHLLEVAHKIDDVLDSCEDSSDAFMTLMSSLIS
jgi:hypothetical protein